MTDADDAYSELVARLDPLEALGPPLLAMRPEDRQLFVERMAPEDRELAIEAFAVAARRLHLPERYAGRCSRWRACRRCAAALARDPDAGAWRPPELGWCLIARRQEVDHYDAWAATQEGDNGALGDPDRFEAGVCHVPWFSRSHAARCAPMVCCYGAVCGSFMPGHVANAAVLERPFPPAQDGA